MAKLNYKKIFALGVIAVIFAIIGWVLPITTTTNESVFQIEVNNTNLAPTVTGETNGTGERVQGVTYYANETPIEIFLWGHGQNISQTAEIHLFINGTKVADTSGRALGAAEQSNKTIVAMIPRYASYMVEVHDIHHYEWREYKVLSGQNGSVIINYINTSSINQSALDLKVNISGSTWTGNMIMDGTSITTNTVGDKDAYIYMESGLPTIRMRARSNGTAGYFELFPYYSDILVSGRRYNFTNTSLDMGNASLINCANCANNTTLDTKVNKYGDTMTGDLLLSGGTSTLRLTDNFTAISVNDPGIDIPGSNPFMYYRIGGVLLGYMSKNAFLSTYANISNNYGQSGTTRGQISYIGTSPFLYNPTLNYFEFKLTGNSTGYKFIGINNSYFQAQLKNSSQISAVCYNSTSQELTFNNGLTTCLASSEYTKTNITNITNDYSASIMQVKPILYNSKLDNSLNYGFSAQQINSVYPELVGHETIWDTRNIHTGKIINGVPETIEERYNFRFGNVSGVKYENMVAILTKVIQEQQTVINKICGNDPTLCT